MRTLAWAVAAFTILVVAMGALGGSMTNRSSESLLSGGGPSSPSSTPHVDGVVMLAEHKAFVKAYPIRDGNHANHIAARNALAAEFAAAGLTVWRQPFTNGISQENICAAKFGTTSPRVWVVVGGHLDTTTWDSLAGPDPAPGHRVSEGAYDDGSGLRMMASLAKTWAGVPTPVSILFCGFDGEERGLQGAREVKRAMDEYQLPGGFPWAVDQTRGMIEMDMYGLNWPLRAPIWVDQNRATLRSWIDDARIAQGVPNDMFRFQRITLGQSDYAHWMNAGIPTAFFISDFEELGVPGTGQAPTIPVPGAKGAYPFWHQVDTWETMTAMAGGDATLLAAFQNGVDIVSETLALFALHPEIAL